MTALATAMHAAPVNPVSAATTGITAASTAMLNGIGSGANVVDVQYRRKHKRSSRQRRRLATRALRMVR
jgi:hypothetical protein